MRVAAHVDGVLTGVDLKGGALMAGGDLDAADGMISPGTIPPAGRSPGLMGLKIATSLLPCSTFTTQHAGLAREGRKRARLCAVQIRLLMRRDSAARTD